MSVEEKKARYWVKFWFSVLSLFLLVASLTSCSYVYDRYPSNYWGPDWEGEELLEAGIKAQTGWDLDLSPFDGEETM